MMNKVGTAEGRPFTGRHMASLLLAFFGVIITVNLTMAYFANSTWSGLVVKNSYVASQEFNGKVEQVKAQEALGWKGKLEAAGGTLRWTFLDTKANPVPANAVTIRFRRPVTEASDATLTLSRAGDATWETKFLLADGIWIAVVDVETDQVGLWRDTLRFSVSQGVIK